MEPVTVATIASTLIPLVKEYGPKVGRAVNEQVNKDQTKAKEFLQDIKQGIGVTDSAKKILGDSLDKVIEDAKKAKKIQYEKHFSSYITLGIDTNLSTDIQNDLLKAELAENLERLQLIDSDEKLNEARMIVNQWLKKFIEVRYPSGNVDQETIDKIYKIQEVLHGKMTAKDIFKKYQRLFGSAGAALGIMWTAYVPFAIAGGIFAKMGLLIFGVPAGQAIAGIGATILFAYLALMPINDDTKIQLVIEGLYRVIDGKIEDFIEILKKENLYDEQEKLFKDLEKRLEAENFSNAELLMVMALLKHMVLVDSHEHIAEVNVVNEYFKHQFGMNDDEIKNLYDSAPVIDDLSIIITDLRENLSIEDKEKLLTTLRQITVADKKIDPKEVALLKEMIATL